MKKSFWVLGIWLLLVSNALMSFSNMTFAKTCPTSIYKITETKWCYVYQHDYAYIPTNYWCSANLYTWTELLSYKCDTEWWVVDLRDAPLKSWEYIRFIWENAFSWTNVTKVIMPSTISNIWEWAFCNVEKDWDPVCWNEIIETWEECDDGSNWSKFCTDECIKTLCWNDIVDQWEACLTCPEDIEANGWFCWKSLWESDFNEELESGDELENNSEDSINIATAKERDGLIFPDFWFVEISFPDGMNNRLNLDNISYSCAELQEFLVTFKMDDGDVLWTTETENQHINPSDVPSIPDKGWYIWWWYLWDEVFNINGQIKEDITLVYKYKKWWIKHDKDNWWIKISLGDQEIIVKDKNQWADKSFLGIVPSRFFDYQDYENDLMDAYFNWDITNEEKDSLMLEWANKNVWTFSNLSDFYDYKQEVQETSMSQGNIIGTIWNYYFRWNNVGINAKKTIFDEENQIIDLSRMNNVDFPEWFNHWYIWLEWWNDWTVWSNDTPCNADKWEYLPSSEDLLKVMQLWGAINWYEVVNDGPYYYFNDFNAIRDIGLDFWIFTFPAVYVNEQWITPDDDERFILQLALDDWKIWYLTYDGIFSWGASNLSEWDKNLANSLAMPVRCFINPIKEEEEIKNHHTSWSSWWWGKRSVSSASETLDKVHKAAEDKIESIKKETENDNQNVGMETTQKKNMNESEKLPQKKVIYVPNSNKPEREQAYDFAHSYGITTKSSLEKAKLNSPLTRIQMAKMLSQYAINVLGKEPDVSKWVIRFKDVTNKMNKEYDNWIILAYQLWIMWQNMPWNKFRPKDEVTRAEFITALSRLLYNTPDWEYKWTWKYYINHMQKLKSEWIITNDNPKMKEKRWYVMIMLMRTAK